MPDTTEPTATITRLISTGVPAPAVLAAIASTFPDLSLAELSIALQCATAAAEKHAARKHCAHVIPSPFMLSGWLGQAKTYARTPCVPASTCQA
jgi:hypothetical protein